MGNIDSNKVRERIILHSDFNSFYASAELTRRPELREKPVSVGGDAQRRHGIILASNPLAKSFGVKTGETLWQARQKCHDLIVLPPDFDFYIELSQKGRDIYLQYTDMVEPFGLDEAWLDVTGSVGLFGDGMSIAREINRRIKAELGLTVSVGVSFNKVFAKLGSDYKKPDGITEISKLNYEELVYPLPASDLLGVGRSAGARLAKMGINTIGDIACFPKEILSANFGKWGDTIHAFANGQDCTPIANYYERADIKSVGNSTTAPKDLFCEDEVKAIFAVIADRVSFRLRELGLWGSVVSIMVKTSSFSAFTRQKKLERATVLSSEIYHCAVELFNESYTWSEPVRSLGISVSEISTEAPFEQLSIFDDEISRDKTQSLGDTVYIIKKRFGMDSLVPAVLLKAPSLCKTQEGHVDASGVFFSR